MKLANLSFIVASLVLGFAAVANAQWNDNVKVEFSAVTDSGTTVVVTSQRPPAPARGEIARTYVGTQGNMQELPTERIGRPRCCQPSIVFLKDGGMITLPHNGAPATLELKGYQKVQVQPKEMSQGELQNLFYSRANAHNALEASRPASQRAELERTEKKSSTKRPARKIKR